MRERATAGSDDSAEGWAARIASGEAVDAPVALVVAHADDETLWAGAALARLRRLTLVHVTDSAPQDMEDALRLGFPTREAYADARAAELEAALAALDARPRRLAYGVPDKGAVDRLRELAEQLAEDLDGMAAVLTHPYEGGHPDHDACALTVRMAVERLQRRTGLAPAVVEFACYNGGREGERRFGAFWPAQGSPEHVRSLEAGDVGRVERAIAAHRTQAGVIGDWRPEAERWRAAPEYDFTAPPPPGALYDALGWAVTSARWREAAARELAAWR